MKRLSQIIRNTTIFLCCAALISCNALQAVEPSKEYLLTVNLTSTDTEQVLLNRYGGVVLSFHPKAGFAILRVKTRPASTDQAIKHLELNNKLGTTDARILPDKPTLVTQGATGLTSQGAMTNGLSVGMNGWTTWSSGWTTWSSGWTTWSSGQALPGNPLHAQSAYMNARVPQAHTIARNFGADVVVAVLDTGVDTSHPAFDGRLVPLEQRWNFVNGNNDVNEVVGGPGYGHGTAVAGIVLQVAPRAKIMPLKVLDSNGSGDLDDVIAAIDFAVRNGARVINLSLGTDQYSEALWAVINNAIANKVYVVAAVGNEGQTNSADFPGALSWNWQPGYMVGVGSVNAADQLSAFTNRGGDVFMFAPGENVGTFAPNNRVANATGTSFSAPLVAGALALAYGEASTPAAQEQIGFDLWITNEKNRVWWRNYAAGQTCDSNGSGWCHSEGVLDVEQLLLSIEGFVPAVQKGSTDFIRNGNFEQGGLSGWTISGRVGFDYNSYSGTNAAVIYGSGSLTQRISGLAPNTTYRLTGWTQVERSSQTVRFSVRNFGRTEVFGTSGQTSFGNLVPISFIFTTGTSNTSADIVLNKSNTTGMAWIDMVTLVRN